MPCNKCSNKNYTNTCGCNDVSNNTCLCPIKDLSTDCLLYTGLPLKCSGIDTNTVMTEVIQELDEFICNKFEEVINFLTLINVGTGARVFRGISNIGEKEIRTIVSENTALLDVIENEDNIGINPGLPSLELDGEVLNFLITTSQGQTTLSSIDLEPIDNYLVSATYEHTAPDYVLNLDLRDNSQIDVSLSELNNHLENVVYNATTNSIDLTITDGTVFNLDVDSIISDAQVQSDYLEDNASSRAHILNRNPSKSITSNYTVLNTDNNYIIEVDNGATDITINLASISATNNFFVGFVQKGTGEVAFVGADIVPDTLTNVIFGQGHIASVEIINNTKYLHGTLKFQ